MLPLQVDRNVDRLRGTALRGVDGARDAQVAFEAERTDAVTHGVDTLILGATQRGALWHAMKGDVLQEVAKYLPERIDLVIHA